MKYEKPCIGTKYRCVESFTFANDYLINNDYLIKARENCTVNKDTLWEVGTDDMCGGEVHLDSLSDDNRLDWIEIGFDDLQKYFVEIKESESDDK